MQVLIEMNTQLSQELEECKAQLQATLAAAGEPKETPSGNIYILRMISIILECGVYADLTIKLQMTLE